MNKSWIIALVLILAVVVVFAACKGNESEEITTQPTTQPTTQSEAPSATEPVSDTESDDTDLELIPGDDLIISDDDYNDEGALIIGGNTSDNSFDNSGEDSISWDEIIGKNS